MISSLSDGGGGQREHRSTLIVGFMPPRRVYAPPLLWRVGAEGAEKILGIWGWFFIDFLHKIDDFEAKTSKIFAPAARFPWELYF